MSLTRSGNELLSKAQNKMVDFWILSHWIAGVWMEKCAWRTRNESKIWKVSVPMRIKKLDPHILSVIYLHQFAWPQKLNQENKTINKLFWVFLVVVGVSSPSNILVITDIAVINNNAIQWSNHDLWNINRCYKVRLLGLIAYQPIMVI